MYTNSLLAVSGALFAVAAAVPFAEPHGHHHKHRRDYVWVSHTEVVVETIPVTVTVWVDDGDVPAATPTSYAEAPKYDVPASSEPAATSPVAYTPPAAPAYTPAASPSSSTSVYVAPVPETTSTTVAPAPYVAPTTPAAYVAPTTSTTPAPAATSASSSGSSVGGMAAVGKTYTGDLTWYDVGLGACGKTNTKSENVIAIPQALFDAYSTGNPNTNPLCGKTISITGKDGSKHTGTVVDRCPGCTIDDLDLSQDFFNKVTNNGDGRVGGMSWCFDD